MLPLLLALASFAQAQGTGVGVKFQKSKADAYAGRALDGGKSSCSVPQAIAFGFKKAADEAGVAGARPQSWEFQNAFAQPIGREYNTLAKEGEGLERRKLVSAAVQSGGGIDKAVALLKGYGASVRMDPIQGAEAASSLAVGVGFKLDVKFNHKGRPGGMLKLMDKSESQVPSAVVPKPKFYRSSGHNNLVVELPLADDGVLYMTRYDKEIKADDAMTVWRVAKDLGGSLNRFELDAPSVKFPVASFNSFEKDGKGGRMSQLEGTKGAGTPWVVKAYGLQAVFFMDHSGSIPLSEPPLPPGVRAPEPFEVNGPYLVWVKMDNNVVFAAQITKDSMTPPKRD